MIKVRATGASKEYNKKIAELGRIAEEGEEFFIEDSRLPVLLGANQYYLCMVERVDEDVPTKIEAPTVYKPEPADVEIKGEVKVTKKTTGKKKTAKK